MNVYEYQQEARNLDVQIKFLKREQENTAREGSIGWAKLELELLGLRIKYLDVKYDLHDARGNELLANRARKDMEVAINRYNGLKKWLQDVGVIV